MLGMPGRRVCGIRRRDGCARTLFSRRVKSGKAWCNLVASSKVGMSLENAYFKCLG